MELRHPVGSDVMAHDVRMPLGRFTLTPAQVLSHVTGPNRVPGYVVAYHDGHRRYLTAEQVMAKPVEYRHDSHLHAVALRARSRSATISARLARLLSQTRAVGQRFYEAPHTTMRLELLMRRRLLGEAAYQLATAVESALDTTGDERLVDHLNVLNEIGVDHNATAATLALEASALLRHTTAIARMADRHPRIAAAMNNHMERNPR